MAQVAREIYVINYRLVDASGACNEATGYPKVIDSHQNSEDLEKAFNKAYKEYNLAVAGMYDATTRPQQVVTMTRMSDGVVIESKMVIRGPLTWNVPDPEPEPEPEPENGGEE